MERRRFGRLEWQVGEVGLGCAWLGGKGNSIPLEKAAETVRRALDLGVNYIDTAPVYGHGYSEQIAGEALEGYSKDCYVATKVGRLPDGFDHSREGVWRCFQDSLKRLRMKKVALVQIHESEVAGWERIFKRGGTLEALKEIREAGLTERDWNHWG